MLKTLGDAGYVIEWRIINAAEYGFPQRRIRVFIVAYRKKLARQASPKAVIQTQGILARALPIKSLNMELVEIDLRNEAAQISSRFNSSSKKSPFLNSGFFVNGVAYTTKTTAKIPSKMQTLKDVLEPDSRVPDSFWVEPGRLKEWRYLKGAKRIERIHKGSGTKYNFAEGKMAFPDLLTKPSRTILTAEGGTTPSRFKHIIKKAKGYRRLTPLELERLNGFPDNWTESDSAGKQFSDTKRAFFMGNALIVGLVEKVGNVIAKEIRG
jgi:DNA (cytosine-5)-methyltransferase 1